MDLKQYLKQKKELIERALHRWMPGEGVYPHVLHRAMRYSIFADGKRIRPILHLASAEAVGGDPERHLPFACAIEMIHTYSLIHDDLPAMDDDELRRGIPTNHVVFGEAIAILAGDALLTEAFHLLSSAECVSGFHPEDMLLAIHEIAYAAGSQGMVGGQAMDIQSEGNSVGPDVLDYIHTHKTGALITASVRTAAILSRARRDELEALTRYGRALGLAFQIRDDLLNVEGTPEELGKAVGSDASRGKATYPGIHGLERAKKRLEELVEDAVAALEGFDGRALPLREIARYIMMRKS